MKDTLFEHVVKRANEQLDELRSWPLDCLDCLDSMDVTLNINHNCDVYEIYSEKCKERHALFVKEASSILNDKIEYLEGKLEFLRKLLNENNDFIDYMNGKITRSEFEERWANTNAEQISA